jgi:hypothetical protein
MEHVNQVLEGYLHIFTSQRQDDWDDFPYTGEFQYNNMVHSSTQQTPFMVDMALGIEEAKVALTKRRMSTPCTTTVGASLPWCSHQGTKSG